AVREGEFIIVYAGSLSHYEGLDDLLTAALMLRHQGVKARVIFVGDGEALEDLQQIAANSEITDIARFVGRVSPDEVRRYLSLADVVAIPRKPFKVCEIVTPLKPLEAMSMGKPVVLTDLAALREMVEDGVTGLLCKPADPGSLTEALKRLAEDADL